jgi:hypothetical protein
MKTSVITFILALWSLLTFSQDRPFRWLEGSWKMKDKNVFEVWEYRDGKLFGKGFELSGQDTVITEEIQISFLEQSFHFIADVPGVQPPVNFRITSRDTNSFVAENSQHDFPKVIRYRTSKAINGRDELFATIEGSGQRLSYQFERLK